MKKVFFLWFITLVFWLSGVSAYVPTPVDNAILIDIENKIEAMSLERLTQIESKLDFVIKKMTNERFQFVLSSIANLISNQIAIIAEQAALSLTLDDIFEDAAPSLDISIWEVNRLLNNFVVGICIDYPVEWMILEVSLEINWNNLWIESTETINNRINCYARSRPINEKIVNWGANEVKIIIDPLGRHQETNENNNVFEKSLNIYNWDNEMILKNK